MEVRVHEIADRIYRFSTFVPDIGPTGFTFNQYLIDDDQPLLFHTGARHMFEDLAGAIATVMPVERLRWVTFGHLESDECGAMNRFLAAAPEAEVAHGGLGCLVSFNDLADRPPVPLADGQVIELGQHRVRHIDTPHVPHGWEARVLFEESTGTLLCGDLFTQLGDGTPVTGEDILEAAALAEDVFGATCLTPNTGPTIRKLAELAPTTLAVMHGSCFSGDGSQALLALADNYDARLAASSGPLT
ncbi:MAG TPA: MBL fold metallo-hydrolase [Acidimicrobiales bacterium]|jgi:flavorubredoxin|nr:MBL fold metallo-hydrolase [Acidimicrobiales bacterium]